VFQHLDVEFLVSDDLLQPAILIFELFQSLRLLAFHTAVLLTPSVIRGLSDLQRLQDNCQVLPGIQHCIRITKVLCDLLRRVALLAFIRHQ
jgi:hypothetical protein